MKKIFLLAFSASLLFGGNLAAQVYQIPNSDFENWSSDSKLSSGWTSFESAGGSLSSFKSQSPAPSKVTGHSGSGVQIYSKSVLGKKANGNLTTGRINMGNINPSNASNYNYSDRSGGYALKFAGRPDAVELYAKFTSGGSPNGRVQFIIHDDCDYRDPELDSQASNRVGKAAVLITACTDWTRFTADFTYDKERTTTQYMLASATTNPTPGGSANDYLQLDDIKLIYYHALSDLKYDGTTLNGFSETTTSYDLSSVDYDATKVSYTIKGAAATAETSYDETSAVLTITVKGDDFSSDETSLTAYTIQFKKPVAETTAYVNALYVDSRAAETGEQLSKDKTVNLLYYPTLSRYDLSISDFTFGTGDDAMNIGDIVVTKLNRTEENGVVKYSVENQDVTVNLWGSAMELPVSVDATVKDGNMTADITISLGDAVITVVFAPALTISAGTSLETQNALGTTNVVMTRSFKQGWNTLCLPFDFTTAQISSDAVAQEFTAASATGLTFSKVSDGTLKAGTPYLVYVPEAVSVGTDEEPLYLAATVASYKPGAVTKGDFTFTGNYSAAMSMSGLYGVADIDGVQKIMRGGAASTIGATTAYFTTTGAGANGLRINFDGTTGITTANGDVLTDDAPVYTIQGVRTGKKAADLPAGIYVSKGRKFIVK